MFRRAKQSALEQGLERAKQAQEAVAQRRWSEGFEHAALAAPLLMAAMKDPANKTRVPQLRQSVNQMLQLAEDAKKGEAEAKRAAEEARRAADDESAQAMNLAHSPHARLAVRATDEEEAVQQGALSDHERRHDRSVAYARQSDGHPEVALYTTGRDRPTHFILEDCEPTHSLSSLRGSASACQCYGLSWRFHFRTCS